MTRAGEPAEVWRGKAYPLGATYDGSGTNFALFSEVAEQVELCLFAADGARGQPVTDDSFVMCFNAHHEPLDFRLPPEQFGPTWTLIIDTAADTWPPENGDDALKSGAAVKVGARSLAVFTTGPVAPAAMA